MKLKAILFVVATVLVGFTLLSWLPNSIATSMVGFDLRDISLNKIFPHLSQYGKIEKIGVVIGVAVGVALILLIVIGGFILYVQRQSLYGNARFANLGDIKKAGLLGDDGIVLGKYRGRWLRLGGLTFVLIAAPTRSGKGVSLVIPNLLLWRESTVVLDIKAENYELTSGFRAKHGQKVVVFNPAAENYKTHRYNPFAYVSEDPNIRLNDLQRIANYLIQTPPNADPMWTGGARELFVGIALYLFESKAYPVTLGEIYRQLNTEKETREYFVEEIEKYRQQLSPQCVSALMGFCNRASKEASGVKASAVEGLRMASNPLVDAATCANDFDLRHIRQERTSIYITVKPRDLAAMSGLLNLFVQQLIDLNTDKALAHYDKQGHLITGDPKYKHQVLLLLDEFTSLGRVETIEKSVAFIAGYGLRLMPIIQSPSQFREHYSEHSAQTIIENHATRILFTPESIKDAEAISKELGNKTVDQKSISSRRGFSMGPGNKSVSKTSRALMLPQEVKELPEDQAIIFTRGVKPIRAKKIRYYDDPALMHRILPPIEVPTVEPVSVALRGRLQDDAIIPSLPSEQSGTDDEALHKAADAFFDHQCLGGKND